MSVGEEVTLRMRVVIGDGVWAAVWPDRAADVLAALRTAGVPYRLRLASAATFLVPPLLAVLRTVALGAGTITLWIGMMEG